jgi:hypothetical protein
MKPAPTSADAHHNWREIQERKFAVKNESTGVVLTDIAFTMDKDSTPLEYMLLILELFHQSCTLEAVQIQKLFLRSNAKLARLFFVDWMDVAIAVRRKYHNDMRLDGDGTDLYILEALLNIIATCTVIDTRKRLGDLRQYGVNWNQCIKRVSHQLSHAM